MVLLIDKMIYTLCIQRERKNTEIHLTKNFVGNWL